MKKELKPGDMLAPLPVIMASVSNGKEDNIITIAWTGIINSEPPMTYISVRPSRHSHQMLKASREFVINIPNRDLVFATDYCGCKTGAKEDKFENMHLTKEKASVVSCPMIKECPINLECRVTQIIELPTHDMFLAEIVKVHAREDLIDGKNMFHPEWAHLIAFHHGKYFGVPRTALLRIGESVMKPSTEKRIANERKAKRREARRNG